MKRLPRELMIDIISRLPMKSVLRCKSVSKSWEALLSDPSFAEAHFNRASALTPFSNYIISDYDKIPYFIEIEEDDDEASTMSKPKHLHRLTEFTSPILMGSCLGYVCFSSTYFWFSAPSGPRRPTNPIYLLNPITGANILLPHFEQTPSITCLYGFGLDVSTQQCKVLLVYLREKTFTVQVHTVGRDYSWRTNIVPTILTDVSPVELTNHDLQTSLPLVFNGSIHWIVSSIIDRTNRFGPKRACILSFQLDTEAFRVIPMPEPLQVIKYDFYNSIKYALRVCGGCLSIIYSPQASFVDVWVMVDYNISDSWVKTYSIQLFSMGISHIRPIGFRKNGLVGLCHFHSWGVSFLSNPPMETARWLAHLGSAIQFRNSSELCVSRMEIIMYRNLQVISEGWVQLPCLLNVGIFFVRISYYSCGVVIPPKGTI